MNNFLAYYNHCEHLRRITHVVNASLAELIPDCKATGKHLPWFKLINMNGRVYDPLTGQFLIPDNYVQSPDFTQSYNRYSYCLNNPLSGTDPSGMHGLLPGKRPNAHHTDDFINMWLHTDGGGYYYSGYSDIYYNSSGDIVTFGEVFTNFLSQDVVDYSNSFDLISITTGAINGYMLIGQGSQGNLNLNFNNSNQYISFNYYDCTTTSGFHDISGYDPGIINQSLWGNIPAFGEGGEAGELFLRGAKGFGVGLEESPGSFRLTNGAYNVYNGYMEDGGTYGLNAQVAIGQAVGGIAGGWGSAAAGAEIGAGIGVWFGGVGAVPGAIIGGIVGGFVGGWIGSKVGGSTVLQLHR